MNSPKTPKNPSNDLASQLKHLGLVLTAQTLDDLLARASTQRWRRANCWKKSPARKSRISPAAASNAAWLRPASAALNPWPTSIGTGLKRSTDP